MSPETIACAFRAACLAELQALKPGNVHVYAAGHFMRVEDFERSAEAAAPRIAEPHAPVGARILAAVEATRNAVGANTNLGIVLLSAPLAAAAERGEGADLRANLADVLNSLDIRDADLAFAAIRLASPAGLGERADHDVRSPARITLLEAMRLAAGRDRIAHAYASVFEDVFGLGFETLAAAEARIGPGRWATASVHLAFLAAFPDSHIARKHGPAAARAVMEQARALGAALAPGPEAEDALLAFDAALKQKGLNPGTSADLTVATLFARRLADPGRIADGRAA